MTEKPDNLPRINIKAWVDAAKNNPDKHAFRQLTEIIIHAVGMTKHLRDNMYLKGGALMAIAYGSERVTGDLDYSWYGEPFAPTIHEEIIDSFNQALAKARNNLGYLQLDCHIQSHKLMPKNWQSDQLSYPALRLKVGYALKGSPQEKALKQNNSANTVSIDISFNEELFNVHELVLEDNASIHAYGVTEVIAEKLRAIIQQTQRTHPHYRRQDVYDIDLLINKFDFEAPERQEILKILREKAASREVQINTHSLAAPEVRSASHAEWNSLRLEVEYLPDFDECYDRVQKFYETLGWEQDL